MGLDVPDLDDHTFEEIIEDARKHIPVHAEEWTDHNVHDPGITILELLAWLAESYGYQLDQVTDAHRKKFLKLAGVQPRGPESATVDLSLSDLEEFDGRQLPVGTPLAVETDDGTVVRFETAEDVTLTRATVVGVVSEHSQGRTDHTAANETAALHYRAFGTDADAGSALYFGFDRNPFESADRLELAVDFHEDGLPAPAEHGDEPVTFEPSLAVAWQYCTDPAEWYSDDAWADLPVHRDETNGFYRGGRVVLGTPDERSGWPDEWPTILDRELFWLRCTPRLRRDDAEATGADLAGVTTDGGSPAVSYEVPPQFDAVRTNVVSAIHRERVPEASLTRLDDATATTVRPNQRFQFETAPVLDAEIHVGGDRWKRVEDFDASGPDDPHYVLDRSEGFVRFGDGRRGAIPPAGEAVVAREVVYGGGTDGNVPGGSTWQFTADGFRTLDVAPLAPPAGGRDAESIDAAFARVAAERRVPYRAVTADDFREIALRTPGLRFGRAATVVDADESADAGCVTVVVVPYSPPTSRPVPTQGFLDAVERHLCEHALLTDRVSVVAPTYVGVDLAAEVSVSPGFAPDDQRRTAEQRLTAFLDPLRGFEGDGWPFGRPVHVSEIYEVLEGLPGVDDVRDVSVSLHGDVDLGLDGTALPYPANVDVVVPSEDERCGRGF